MRLTEQWICIQTQYTCLHLKGCYGVHPACMAEPSGQNWTCYIYVAHVCTGACRRGFVHFRRNMRWNDKEYLDSQEKCQGIGDVL